MKIETMSELYEKIGKQLIEAPIYSPRGMETKELVGQSFELVNPRNRLMFNDLRKFGLAHAIVESLMLFVGCRSLQPFTHFNKEMTRFSDDGRTLHGSYGYRLFGSIYAAIKMLKEDPDTRRCVLNIYSNEKDLYKESKDIPCTLTIQFMIRNNKLNMHVNMRSNDIIWGTPYDVFMFTIMQEVVANELGIDVGSYYHNAASLHVYSKHYYLLDELSKGVNNIDVGFRYDHNFNSHYNAALDFSLLTDSYDVPISRAKLNNEFIKYLVCENEWRKSGREPIDESRLESIGLPRYMFLFSKRWLK